ncbi:MAG: hypothetical protein IPM13_06935 [Phycisphaerales bacterium]|nr:hypothetical protein [Phycisphaerales bacterium]
MTQLATPTPLSGGAAALDAPVERPDVWAWTGAKYRVRAVLLLVLNFTLYCGLCVFTHWLHVGQAFDFSFESYAEPFRFWGPNTLNLYDFILYPISVEQTPMHGVVIGLLIATVVAIPIAVAILYRFPCSLPFTLAVFVLGHLPWLAVTLTSSCILASVRPFRLRFRYGAALVGLLPVLLYLFLATRGASDLLSASISPERKLLLAGPWILAILGACTMLAIILLIAQSLNCRPGSVAPVMGVMFALPVTLFHAYVGFDELAYRAIEIEYGPRARRFEPVQDATDAIFTYFRERMDRGADRGARRAVLLALWSERPEQQAAVKHRVTNYLRVQLLRDRQAAYDACKQFLETHLASRFIPNVLYIQARVLDTRLDELRFQGEDAKRELYTDFPHVQSEPIWSTLLTRYPQSPLAVAARLRLAQHRLRQGDVGGALTVLNMELPPEAQRRLPARGPRPLLVTVSPESTLEIEPDAFIFESERLRELILANGGLDAPERDREALQALASLDPHRAGYRDQLARLAAAYADRPLHDNIVVRWASHAEDRRLRAELLAACLERFDGGDAYAEALFQLADLDVQRAGGDAALREAGIARLNELVSRFGETCWGRLAAERLTMLMPRTATPVREGG